MKLNLGCGQSYLDGYVNLDRNPLLKADVCHDLNSLPYPFADNTFDEILASHVLEHLDKPFEIMRELHRILRPGGKLLVRVPHFSRGFTHTEHTRGFDVTFPKYFNSAFTSSGYFGIEYQLVKSKLHWMSFFHLLPYYGYSPLTINILRGINWIVSGLANLAPNFCSRIWCFWVGGFEEIEFEFINAKK